MTFGAQSVGDLDIDMRVTRGEFELSATLTAKAGQVTAIVGPNGSGKSTLLRVIAGLEPIQEGHLQLGDRVLDDGRTTFVPAEKRPIGMVFQDYLLFPHLNVLDNIAFGVQSRGATRQAARKAGREWLADFDLSGLASRRPAQLSGGQAQRVALLRALATTPEALLLDEPLAALDAGTKTRMRGELSRRLTEFPGVALLVTHEPLEALVLADHICVLEGGRVVQSGSVEDVAARPASDYVAALMGVNLLRGSTREGRMRLDAGGDLIVASSVEGRVFATIRPSAVTVHQHRPEGSARNSWKARVEGLEEIGDRVRVVFAGEPGLLVDVTATSVATLGLVPGASAWLAVKATEIDVYPAP